MASFRSLRFPRAAIFRSTSGSLPLLAAACVLSFCFCASPAALGKQKPKLPAVRWDEQHPGCTFTRSEDGKYRYGLWSGELGVTLTLDSQELEKVRRRHEPFFGVLVNIRYRGTASFDVETEEISLQFLKHFKVAQTALDPDDFGEKIETDAETQDHATAREVEKHPEQKDAKEAYTRAFQKDAAELLEFVSKNSLRPAHLDPGKPEVTGWVLFSTNSRWISKWKKREYFVLRIPLQGTIFEFPFQLPPEKGELILRHRE